MQVGGIHAWGWGVRCVRAREEESRARADSSGFEWSQPGPAEPTARFSKHRKVMKYRGRRAKLLMRHGSPV